MPDTPPPKREATIDDFDAFNKTFQKTRKAAKKKAVRAASRKRNVDFAKKQALARGKRADAIRAKAAAKKAAKKAAKSTNPFKV